MVQKYDGAGISCLPHLVSTFLGLLKGDALEVVPISLCKSEKVKSGGEVLTGNAVGRAGGEGRFSFINALAAQVLYPPMGWPIRRPNYIYGLLRRHRIHPQPSPAARKATRYIHNHIHRIYFGTSAILNYEDYGIGLR
jgi:hypothetical protein